MRVLASAVSTLVELHGEDLIQTRRGNVRLLDYPGLRAFGASRLASTTARTA